MVGMWDGVPASPCSGASDEAPFPQSAPRQSKRFRAASSTRRRSQSVEFVGATGETSGNTVKNVELASKLNNSAADERRKALLTQLRLIDRRKAALRIAANGVANGRCSSAPGDIIEPVIEAATPEPNDADLNNRSLVLDISAAKSIGRPVDMSGFCSSPTARSTAKPKARSRSKAKSKPTSPSSPSLSYADLANPTRRTSRRATRPRTPSVLLNGMPGETVLRSLPVGVLKCKRYAFSKKVISLLFKAPAAGPFTAPVKELWKPEAVPRYFDVITKPMDLGTIKKNMEDTTYLNMQESDPLRMFNPMAFAEDVRQVFRNAQIYNKEGDVLHNCAGDLMKEFEAMWESLPGIASKADNRRKRQAIASRSPMSAKRGRIEPQPVRPRFTTKPTSLKGKKAPKSPVESNGPYKVPEDMTTRQMKKRVDYLKKCRIALRSRTVLPKGASFYDRAAMICEVPLADGEKNEIAKAIKKLPATKLKTVLDIIGAHEDDGDLELDVSTMDVKTLREIEAFLETAVSGFKTIRNSDIGLEYMSESEFEGEIKALEKRLAEPTSKARSKKSTECTEPRAAFAALPDTSAQLYASSDEDSDESDSDSDGDSDSD